MSTEKKNILEQGVTLPLKWVIVAGMVLVGLTGGTSFGVNSLVQPTQGISSELVMALDQRIEGLQAAEAALEVEVSLLKDSQVAFAEKQEALTEQLSELQQAVTTLNLTIGRLEGRITELTQ